MRLLWAGCSCAHWHHLKHVSLYSYQVRTGLHFKGDIGRVCVSIVQLVTKKANCGSLSNCILQKCRCFSIVPGITWENSATWWLNLHLSVLRTLVQIPFSAFTVTFLFFIWVTFLYRILIWNISRRQKLNGFHHRLLRNCSTISTSLTLLKKKEKHLWKWKIHAGLLSLCSFTATEMQTTDSSDELNVCLLYQPQV